MKYALLGGAVFLLTMAGWFSIQFNTAADAAGETVRFEVEEGWHAKQIAEALAAGRIITRKWPFLMGYRLFFSGQSLKAGEYRLETPLSPKQVIQALVQGQVLLYPITIPEGLTRRETAQRLDLTYSVDAEAFLTASAEPGPMRDWDAEAVDLEGYLLPETYHVPKDVTPAEMVEAMVIQFRGVFSEDWKRRTAELGLRVRGVVILASLVEKETSRAEERAQVSAVFHNRLRIGMKLDCDPTIVYALKNTDSYTGRLRYKDLKLDSPYNTYLYPGLPPGPIANPGRASLEAALYPADVDYLYFVSRNDGSHEFSSNYRDHINAVNKYQRRRLP
jgi:UPF0755 protein